MGPRRLNIHKGTYVYNVWVLAKSFEKGIW